MEKRFYFGVFLLVILLISGFFAASFLYHTHMPQAKRLQADQSTASIDEAKQVWERNWKITASLIDHSSGEQIDGLFDKLLFLEDPELIRSACQELSVQLEAVAESHLLYWWNII